MKRMSWISFWQILLPSFRSNLDCKRKPISFSPINSIYTEGKSRMSCFEWIPNGIIRNSLEKIREKILCEWTKRKRRNVIGCDLLLRLQFIATPDELLSEWMERRQKNSVKRKANERHTRRFYILNLWHCTIFHPTFRSFVLNRAFVAIRCQVYFVAFVRTWHCKYLWWD